MSKRVRRTSHSPLRWLALALGLILVQFSAAAMAMDVATVRIGVGNERTNGVLEPQPYYLDVTVDGAGVAEVHVTTPRGTVLELFEVKPGIWWNEMAGYSSLDDLRDSPSVGFGDFSIDVVGERGEGDGVTLYFDPGYQDQFTGYGQILFPAHQQESVTLEPTFEWECADGCFTRSWDVRVVNGDGTWRHRDRPPIEVVTWAPGPVSPYEPYRFSCHSFGLLEEAQTPTTTGGDSFTYETLFQTRNEALFTALERIELNLDRGQLTWAALTGEVMYEVARGDLNGLRATGGSFSANTEECLADDVEATTLPYTVDPGPGESFWFLVRSSISPDGYETLLSGQQEDRTAEIAGSGAACPGYSCPIDVPAYYDQPNPIAGGVCVELAGIDGPAACPQEQYARAVGDIAAIMDAYPFTEAVEDSVTGAGQQWRESPFGLLCADFQAVPLSEHLFDDLNACYEATPLCRFGCVWVNPEFQWAVNVWSLLDVYDARAARYGGWCEFDRASGTQSPLGGFHAVDSGDGWWEWTVHATSECDHQRCRCDAVLSGWTLDSSPGQYWENTVTDNSTPECTDLRFAF